MAEHRPSEKLLKRRRAVRHTWIGFAVMMAAGITTAITKEPIPWFLLHVAAGVWMIAWFWVAIGTHHER